MNLIVGSPTKKKKKNNSFTKQIILTIEEAVPIYANNFI